MLTQAGLPPAAVATGLTAGHCCSSGRWPDCRCWRSPQRRSVDGYPMVCCRPPNPADLLGPADGRVYAIGPGTSVTLPDFAPVPGLDIAQLLTPDKLNSGDVVNTGALARAYVVAFARHGASPIRDGPWESCAWTFKTGASTVNLRLGRRGQRASRPPHLRPRQHSRRRLGAPFRDRPKRTARAGRSG